MSTHTTTPPALPDLWDHSAKLNNYPKLSYSVALTLWILPEQGEPVIVGAFEQAQFEAFIERSLSAYPCHKKVARERLSACKAELTGVEFDSLGKWFSLDLLLSHGIPVALFRSFEEAAAYQKMCG